MARRKGRKHGGKAHIVSTMHSPFGRKGGKRSKRGRRR